MLARIYTVNGRSIRRTQANKLNCVRRMLRPYWAGWRPMLVITENTVEKHLRAIFKKLGVRSRLEAALASPRLLPDDG